MVIIKCYFVSASIREEGKNLNINRTYSVQGRILKDTELEKWVKYGQKKRQITQAGQYSISKNRKWQEQYMSQLLGNILGTAVDNERADTMTCSTTTHDFKQVTLLH